jgi:anti-anti-sigma factor
MTTLLEETPRGLSRLFKFRARQRVPLERDPSNLKVPGCSIALEVDGIAGVLAVRGDMDASSIPALIAQSDKMRWSNRGGQFVIDLRGVTRVDSDAVSALSAVWRAISTDRGYLVVLCEKGPVADWLAGTELHLALHVQPAAPSGASVEEPADQPRARDMEPVPSLAALRRLGAKLASEAGLAS